MRWLFLLARQTNVDVSMVWEIRPDSTTPTMWLVWVTRSMLLTVTMMACVWLIRSRDIFFGKQARFGSYVTHTENFLLAAGAFTTLLPSSPLHVRA